MNKSERRAFYLILVPAVVVLAVDQLTKAWARTRLPGKPIDVIEGVLTLRYATNRGAAFSFGEGAPWVFALASMAVLFVIAATSLRHKTWVTALGAGLLAAGAMGNLTDRIIGPGATGVFTGQVVDFIDFHIWPIFNVADMAVVGGMGLLLFASLAPRRVDADSAPEAIQEDSQEDGRVGTDS